MKRLFIPLFLLIQTLSSFCCPACVGRIEKDSPPFFSEELYQNTSSESVEIDLDALLKE